MKTKDRKDFLDEFNRKQVRIKESLEEALADIQKSSIEIHDFVTSFVLSEPGDDQEKAQQREDWLQERGKREIDVEHDEQGEFVRGETDEYGTPVIIRLPKEIQ